MRASEAQQFWDNESALFDNEPDHGLREASVREAWQQVLKPCFPSIPAQILDVGCGTGSLSVLLAEWGHVVTGIDISPAMIGLAQEKAKTHQQEIDFRVMDAAFPSFLPATFAVIVCRHLLWALPEPEKVLQHWVTMLKPDGYLVLIEGFWHTGAGLHAEEIISMIPALLPNTVVHPLSDSFQLWVKEVTDERYMVIAKPSDKHSE
jgi:2-polyprenyl-3-methyl-5-hydroxy-6-metoxy-1,4-benzoquinol methylase